MQGECAVMSLRCIDEIGRQFGFIHAPGDKFGLVQRPKHGRMAFALAFSAFMLCGETVSTNVVTAFLRGDNSRFQIVTSC